MTAHSGIILLSVVSLLVIGGAFELQRYANFCERQQMYRLMIWTFDHPEQTVDAVPDQKASDGKAETQPLRQVTNEK